MHLFQDTALSEASVFSLNKQYTNKRTKFKITATVTKEMTQVSTPPLSTYTHTHSQHTHTHTILTHSLNFLYEQIIGFLTVLKMNY